MTAALIEDTAPESAQMAAHLTACCAVARSMAVRYDWTLVDPDDLAQCVADSTPPGAADVVLKSETVHQYTLITYAACGQRDDSQLREQAFAEVLRFLQREALRRHRDVADEAASEACSLVFHQFDRCRQPDAFLAFALLKLWQCATAIRRDMRRRSSEVPLAVTDATSESTDTAGFPEPVAAPERSDPAEQVLTNESRTVLLGAMRRLPGRCRIVASMKFLAGMSHEDIGARLGITNGNVRQLLCRARTHLRQDVEVGAYFSVTGCPDKSSRAGCRSRHTPVVKCSFGSEGLTAEPNDYGQSG